MKEIVGTKLVILEQITCNGVRYISIRDAIKYLEDGIKRAEDCITENLNKKVKNPNWTKLKATNKKNHIPSWIEAHKQNINRYKELLCGFEGESTTVNIPNQAIKEIF